MKAVPHCLRLLAHWALSAVAFALFVGGGPIRLLFGAGMVLAGFGVTGAIVPDLTLEEARRIIHHDGLIPDLP